MEEAKNIQGLRKLFIMAEMGDKTGFYRIANKIPVDKLDCQILIGFLKSGDSDVRDGARSLLDKILVEQVEVEDEKFIKKYFS